MATKALRATLLAAVGSLALAACNLQVHPRDESTGSSGSTINLLIGGDNGSPTMQRNFNPYLGTHRTSVVFMYEPLVYVNGITSKETPFLATAHQQPSASSVVFTIRSAVRWSDGQAFTPDDVIFTFNLLKRFPALDVQGIWQHIKSVSAAGDKVTVTLKTPDVPAVQIIEQTLIVPKHSWQSIKDPVTATNPNPVVTGPYVLDRFNPNQYTLKKNPNYWQADKVVADRLTFPGSNTQLDVVKNGYDWAYSFIPDVQGTWVGSKKQTNHYWFPPGGTISLFLNLTKAPFDNLDFRKGLSYALDRKTIADKAETGYVQPATQAGLLLPNQQVFLDPSLPDGGNITQDTSKALSYFSKAGFTRRGNALVDKSGHQLKLTLMVPSGYTDWLQGVQTVQQQLRQIGINVGLQTPQPPAAQQALQNGNFDVAVSAFGGSGIPHQDFSLLLDSRLGAPVGKQSNGDFAHFHDPKVNALLDQLKQTTDTKKQLAIIHQLEHVVYDQVPVVALFYGGLWGLYSTKKVTGWPSQHNPYAPLTPWTSASLLIMTKLQKAK